MILHLSNKGSKTINNCQLKFNKNQFGLNCASQPSLSGSISPNSSQAVRVPLKFDPGLLKDQSVQMAIKTELGVAYFSDDIDPAILLTPKKMETSPYGAQWKSLTECEPIVVNQLKDLTSFRSKY